MEWVVRNKCVGCLGTTDSRDITLDLRYLISSEMSVLHGSHVFTMYNGQYNVEND